MKKAIALILLTGFWNMLAGVNNEMEIKLFVDGSEYSIEFSKIFCELDILKNATHIIVYSDDERLARVATEVLNDRGYSAISYHTGCIPPDKEEGEIATGLNNETSPSWDWRNVNGFDWTTPVKNQGNCGSCWDFAATGALEAVIKIRENCPQFNPDLSEQYLLSCSAGSCDGWATYYAYTYIYLHGGALPEECFPYYADDSIPCSMKCEDWKSKLVPIKNYRLIWKPTINQIKNAIVEYGPVVSSMAVYPDFFYYNGGIYEHDGDEPVSAINHEVVIVGYNDSGGYWICKNSWGTSWGEDGWFRIKYNDCRVGYYIVIVEYDEKDRNWEPVINSNETYYARVGENIEFIANCVDPDNDALIYKWEFGDGNTAYGKRALHSYAKEGKYVLRLSVSDGKWNSTKTFYVYIDSTAPSISILKPRRGFIYRGDKEFFFPSPIPIIFGEISVEVNVIDNLKVERVEFYVDGNLMHSDESAPYKMDAELDGGFHIIRVMAYDVAGNSSEKSFRVLVV